jgi:hypothetical protein
VHIIHKISNNKPQQIAKDEEECISRRKLLEIELGSREERRHALHESK